MNEYLLIFTFVVFIAGLAIVAYQNISYGSSKHKHHLTNHST
ncbi:hypothetical protein SPONN_2164 [uncultured Candidatus Thioglobus sp.]|nr:hypothetical protein SPONL_1607 [uncultured Candidatus Thioglobus sp.]SMN01042.1 hypothetical protein SPONN_2164 [uncultured Candidatus Thioglobus sp.]